MHPTSGRGAATCIGALDRHSRATFELEPVGSTVKLTVTHEINRDGSKFLAAVSNGWPHILAGLKSLLETRKALEATSRWPKGK